jgi:hypothetical protein
LFNCFLLHRFIAFGAHLLWRLRDYSHILGTDSKDNKYFRDKVWRNKTYQSWYSPTLNGGLKRWFFTTNTVPAKSLGRYEKLNNFFPVIDRPLK